MKTVMEESSDRSTEKTSRSRGVATVEMALTLPFLILLVIGVIDVSRATFVGIAVANAASAGTLYGAQGPGYAVSGVLAAANADAQVSGMTIIKSIFCECVDTSETSPTCGATDCPSSRRLDYIQGDTSAAWVPLFSYPGIPAAVTLTGQATVQIAE